MFRTSQQGSASNRRGSARSQLFMMVRTKNAGTLWAWDIGLGGMACKGSRLVWPGTYVDLDFTLPGTKESLRVGAQVISIATDPDGAPSLSLRFVNLSDRDKLAIYRFLDRRRYLWEDKRARQKRLNPELERKTDEQPFAELLRDAYGQMRLKELRAERKLALVT